MTFRRSRRQKRATNSQTGSFHVPAEQLESRVCLSAVGGGTLYAPNELLVQYEAGTSPAERADARSAVGAEIRQVIHTRAMERAGSGIMERVDLPGNMTVEAAAKMFAANPNVKYAEPNYILRPAIANDPSYTNGNLWGMYSDDQPTSVGPTGTTNQYGSQAEKAWDDGQTGSSSVVIGVIDEGIDINHPDLAANIWTNPGEIAGNGIDDDGNGYVDDINGWDFFNDDASVFDGSGDDHGTHCAGTIGAVGNNGVGVAGVAWNTTMISVKFLGPTGGSTANAILSVDYITDLKVNYGVNVKATSNSWGGGGFSQGLFDAIDRADQADILFVAAAGNSGVNNDNSPHYPSSYTNPNVIAVAALNSSGSNMYSYGPTSVDIGAPGGSIRSTLPGNSYGNYSGTSMATPHVSGAIALYASQYPNASGTEIRDAILTTAVPTTSLDGIVATNGRLDVFAALQSGNQPGVQINVDPVNAELAEGNSGTTTFNFTIAMDEPSTTSDPIVVNWILDLPNSAADANDFIGSTATSGSVTFQTPQDSQTLSQTISFDVLGDLDVEPDEPFQVVLTSTTGGELSRTTAVSKILGDDARIDGIVWNDLNQSGSQDAGDVPAEGITVYADANDDGQLSNGEVTAVTDVNGVYSLPVAPGDHVVRLSLGANQEQTFPLSGDGNVEPDDYSSGSILNSVGSPGVLLSGVGNAVANNNVVAQSTAYRSTGSLSFGSSWNGGLWNTVDAELRADFGTTVNSVSIDFISDDSSDFGHMRAYNASGSLLAEYVTGDLSTGAVETMTITRATNEIAYVLASGRNGQFGFLDNLVYSVLGSGSPAPIRLTLGAEVNSGNEFGVYQTIPNDPPVANADSVSTSEDEAVVAQVLNNDTDPNGDSLSILSFTNPANGTVTNNNDGTLTYTPNANYNGSDSFTYTISDGNGGTDTATVSVSISAVNDAPVAANDSSDTDYGNAVSINVLTNDSDVDGDSLSVLSVTSPANGTVTNDGNGVVTYTPNVGFSGTDSFDYVVSDGQLSDTGTVTVTVGAPPNDPPVANNDSVGTSEDQAVVAQVLDNDTDANGDALSISSFTNPANGSVTDNGNGTLTYTPDANFNGSDSFNYTISDGNGGTDSATVSVTISAVNDAPVAVDDSTTTNVGDAVSINVLTNDSDIDGDSLSLLSLSSPANGTVTDDGNGVVTYTPNGGFSGTDTFDYVVSDGALSDTGTVTVTVESVPGSIIVNPTSLTTVEGGSAKQFTIELGTTPTADVTIAITSSDTTEGTVSTNSVVIAAGTKGPVTVTVNPVDDLLAGSLDGDQQYTVITGAAVSNDAAYSGLDPADVAVTNQDNDSPVERESVAVGETPVLGSISGTFDLTTVDDGNFQQLSEVVTPVTGGRKPKNGSALEHHWSFVGLNSATAFKVNGFKQGGESEGFAFEYSTDNGASWIRMVTLTSTSETTLTASNLSLSGDVLVRAIDTDRSPSNGNNTPVLDDLFVDYMAFTSLQEDFRPAVSITAVDPTAAEGVTPDPGTIQITLDTVLSQDLTVTYAVGGSATSGSDYSSIGTSVVIPAGSSSATVTVNPLDDNTEEGAETVVVTLDDGALYRIEGTDNATVTIEDDDLLVYVANADISTEGSLNGNYQATHVDDGSAQEITERESGGKKSNRYTYLDHVWSFQVSGANSFELDARTVSSIEGFTFEYSLNNSTYLPFGTPVVVTSSTNDTIRTSVPGLNGTVYVRVTDTNQVAGERTKDSVSIDFMAFSTAPAPSGANGGNGGSNGASDDGSNGAGDGGSNGATGADSSNGADDQGRFLTSDSGSNGAGNGFVDPSDQDDPASDASSSDSGFAPASVGQQTSGELDLVFELIGGGSLAGDLDLV